MTIEEVNKRLSNYSGGRGRLWDFSPTHDRVAVQLCSRSGEETIYLVLLGCTDLRIPTLWKSNHPAISTDESSFVFSDKDIQIAFAHEFQLNDTYSP